MSLMKAQVDSKSLLGQIMIWGTSLAVGFAAASLAALQPDFSFRLSPRTFLAGAMGAAFTACYWRILLSSTGSGRKYLRVGASALLFCGGVAGFLYPLRFIAPDNYSDVLAGLAIAFCGLTGVALLLFWCKRFLDKDSQNNA
jgi:hypothetical protein